MKLNQTLKPLKYYKEFYQKNLLNNTLKFWFPNSLDHEFGGYLLMRDQDGTLIDDDKAVWIQGRFTWLLSTLYNTVEKNNDWLAGAKLGADFLKNYGFDEDGRMFFQLTRDGKPIRKRRYFYSETFAAIGFASYGKASANVEIIQLATETFNKCIAYALGEIPLPKKYCSTRPTKGIGVPMIMINTTQQIRETIGHPDCDKLIEIWINEIENDFVKDDIRCVMEQVSLDGEILDHIDTRTILPGHAIEAAWFIFNEACYRGKDERLINLGKRILDYSFERGWDKEYGGLYYFRDVNNKPVQEYYHDMKFWWPHNELIIASLFAYLLTGEEKYAHMHHMTHEYAYTKFSDNTYGEWYGYLNRKGEPTHRAKGNMFKGPFHLPRQEWVCYQLIDKYEKGVLWK